MWNQPLGEIDAEFKSDFLKYIKSIENFKHITPIERKLVKLNERIISVVLFHDASVSSLGALIYLLIQSDSGKST